MTRDACAVLVIGGGVAGALAAAAAARAGAATILLEREAALGGIGQAGMFRRICGLYRNGGSTPGGLLNDGLPAELVARLATAPERVGKVWLQPLGSFDLERLLTELCAAESQLQVLRGHTVTAVSRAGDAIQSVTAAGPDGSRIITPNVAIDCTGDGSVAVMAGADYELPPPAERQLAGFTVQFRGLDDPAADLALQVPFACARGAAAGALPARLRFTTFARGEAADDGYCKLSIAGDAPDRDRQARADAHLLRDFLAAALPAFREATLVAMSPRVLEREGRSIHGEYRLTAEDIVAARKFPDGVIRNAWPMESWERERGPVYRYGPDGDYYEIPFRCLKVGGFANLLCAGRCISVTRAALASTRVMGACMALGEQAGRAAAFHAAHGGYPPECQA